MYGLPLTGTQYQVQLLIQPKLHDRTLSEPQVETWDVTGANSMLILVLHMLQIPVHQPHKTGAQSGQGQELELLSTLQTD